MIAAIYIRVRKESVNTAMSRMGLFVSGIVLCACASYERLNGLEEQGGGNLRIDPKVFAEQFISPITCGLPPLVATVLLCKRIL